MDEDAMQDRDTFGMQINIGKQSVGRMEVHNHTTTVTNSPGAIIASGGGTNVNATSQATVQGLQDVAELLAAINASPIAGSVELGRHLEVVRCHLADGAGSKAEAKAAWERFTERAASIAGASVHIWELMSRVARLLA